MHHCNQAWSPIGLNGIVGLVLLMAFLPLLWSGYLLAGLQQSTTISETGAAFKGGPFPRAQAVSTLQPKKRPALYRPSSQVLCTV